jgi:sarcosine/dimethylglycine N-methyltransferase
MANEIRSAIDFYDQHPISAQIILAKLAEERRTLDGLRPDELIPHDQDHYGFAYDRSSDLVQVILCDI